MMNRLAWLGLLVAVGLAVFMFNRAQEGERENLRMVAILSTLQNSGFSP